MAATFKDQVARLNDYPTPTSFKFLGSAQNLNIGTALDMLFTALNASGGMYNTASGAGALTPSATANAYGTAFNAVAPNPISTYGNPNGSPEAAVFQTEGVACICPLEVNFTTVSIGSETLTFQITATYNDSSTVTIHTKTATATGSTPYAIADMTSLFVNGKYITNLALAVASSIASSTATVTGAVYGLSQLCNVQFPALV